ncbi:MAG: HAMP domain-containing sensor histidine kinase, partial [Acidobacteriota bacterium]
MKVRTRIRVGLSILIVSGFGALLLQSLFISHLRDVTIDLKDIKLPAVEDTRDLIQQLERLHRAVVILTENSHRWRDPFFLENFKRQFARLKEARTEAEDRIGRLKQFVDTVGDNEIAEACRLAPNLVEVMSRWEPYTEIATQIQNSFPGGRPRRALNRLAAKIDEESHQAFKLRIEALSSAIDCVVDSSVSDSVNQADRAVALSIVLLVFALGASLWAGIWMGRSVTGPLTALTRAHRKWMQEDFSHRVAIEGHSKDEFGQLALSGNAMAERLWQQDELKKDFLSHVSHELKSPLNAIQGSAQMLLRETSGTLTPRQRRRLELMLENGERLSKNILNLLDYSRLEAGVFHYHFAEQDLIPVLHRFLESLEPAVLEQGLRLEKRIPVGRPVRLRCDAERLLQVVGNLVDNALKFSPADSCLAVRLEVRDQLSTNGQDPLPTGPFALISVIDSGPGVPQDQRESIFTKFHQVTGSRKGVGLGLAICRKIMQAHQGRIWYEDNPEGGSIFRVLVPMAVEESRRRQEEISRSQESGIRNQDE